MVSTRSQSHCRVLYSHSVEELKKATIALSLCRMPLLSTALDLLLPAAEAVWQAKS